MPLSPGSRLGSYDVLAKLGEGGMGEVYRARDTKLGREVALRILPEAFASDPDRLMRFEREARTLASLNHPHIAQVYGIEDSGSTRALVMELVAGEDLSARIARGPILLDEALPIARQIAEALEAAHESGIIHRDLKPANIKVRDDGTVKVLDFGLAKALETDATAAAEGATITSPAMTMRGVILGTAAYMAPEQAKGKVVDKRADIWAFGCVLYEMLTGRPVFSGDSVVDVLGSVVKSEPEWQSLPSDIPPLVHVLLRRCLQKDATQRLRDIGDARLLLTDTSFSAMPAAAASRPASRRAAAAWLAVVVIAAGIGSVAAARLWAPESVPPAEVRFEIATPDALGPLSFAISADGRRLAWVSGAPGQPSVWVRDLDATEPRMLAGTEDATQVSWSASGRWIAFMRGSENRLMRIAVDGGAPELVAENALGGAAWLNDSELLFTDTQTRRLQRVSAAGGTPAPIFGSDYNSTEWQAWPALLPDGDHFVYYARPSATNFKGGELRIGSLASRTSTPVMPSLGRAAIAAGTSLLFERDNALLTQRLDPVSFALVGEPVRVSASVAVNRLTSDVAVSASPSGTVVFRTAADALSRWDLRLLSIAGEPLHTVAAGAQPLGPALSPDHRRVIFHRLEPNGGDLWIASLADGSQQRFTFDASQRSAAPVWSPDGSSIVFRARRGSTWLLVQKPSNGVGAETVLGEFPNTVSPMTWAANGQHLLFVVDDPKTSWDIWQYSFADRTVRTLLDSPATEGFPQFSPDGRWFAYTVHGVSGVQLYVESFPRGHGKWQVTPDAPVSLYPRWRGDGRQLLFFQPARGPAADHPVQTVSAVDVRLDGEGLAFGLPRALFTAPAVSGPVVGYSGNYMPWAVTGDGQRFLLQQPASAEPERRASSPLVVVLDANALRDKE